MKSANKGSEEEDVGCISYTAVWDRKNIFVFILYFITSAKMFSWIRHICYKISFLFSHFLFAEKIYKREYKIYVAQTPVCKFFGIWDKLYF